MIIQEIQGLHLGNFYLKHSKPEHPVLIYHDQQVTYQELERKIQQYAAYLKQQGIQKGDVVALSCYNVPEFIYSYFAVIQIGAIVLPLNLTLTVEEIGYILKDSKASCLLIHEKIAAKLKLEPTQIQKVMGLSSVIMLSKELEEKVSNLVPFPSETLDPQEVCTLLYTSGTTGKPKGVMLSHFNLITDTIATSKVMNITHEDVFLAALSFFHTFGFTVTVLLPFYCGSSIVIHDAFQPKEIVQSMLHHQVTIFSGVPSMYIVLSQVLKSGTIQFPALRLAVSGGAALPVEILTLFNEQFGIPLIEGYGLTETSPVASFNPLEGAKKLGSIGIPVQGVQIKIVNDEGAELPAGEKGEILIQGPNVMKGYLNLPEETAKALVDGWFHTGDIACKDEEGYIFIVDRKKDLIITRGLNVYPREIEEVLYQHPLVLEAAVIGVPDSLKGEVVKAFVVPKEGQPLDKSMVMEFLKPKLAAYKLPKFVEIVASLPKNATGKILKKELT